MSSQAFVLKPEQQSRALNVVGMQIRILAANAATQGYGITLQEGPEGAGPPPHSHGWDEAFYVLRGKVDVHCGAETTACESGTLIHVPKGTVHAFTFGRGGGSMLEITGPGANAAPFFEAIDEQIPVGPPDIPKLLTLAAKHGVQFTI
jgi:quercetin dioxygenase-like cupin family protein